jgi:hypothetical protein
MKKQIATYFKSSNPSISNTIATGYALGQEWYNTTTGEKFYHKADGVWISVDQTFLNARVQSVTSSTTVTPTSTNDLVTITAQAEGLTIANPTGTMSEGQALMIRIKDNGTARAIAFGTNYRAIGITLPTTTVISKTMYLSLIWNATDTKFDVIGLNQEV